MSKFKKMLNSKWGIIIITLIIASLITLPRLIPSYNMDSYQTFYYGYKNYADLFFGAGRYITGILYLFFDLINLRGDILSVISIVLNNIVLSITCYLVYSEITKCFKEDKKTNIIIYISSFLICFNPFTMENFVFLEGYMLSLAFLAAILSAKVLLSNKKNKYIKSFLLLFLSSVFYQGTLCIFIPYVFLITTLKNKELSFKENIKKNFKFYLYTCIIYSLTLIAAFLLLKVFLIVFDMNSVKFGRLDIIENIKIIFKLMITYLRNLFNFVNSKVFYGTILLLLIIIFRMSLHDNSKNNKNFISIILLGAMSVILAFVPNIVMNTSYNTTYPRMVISIGAVVGMLIVMSLIFLPNKNKNVYLYIILSIAFLFFTYNCYNYVKSSYYELSRYKNDLKYAENIGMVINNYEKENDKEVKNILYRKSDSVEYFYEGLRNSINVRYYSIDWAFVGGTNFLLNKNYDIKTMSDEDFDTHINRVCEDDFLYSFYEDTMYLVLCK